MGHEARACPDTSAVGKTHSNDEEQHLADTKLPRRRQVKQLSGKP